MKKVVFAATLLFLLACWSPAVLAQGDESTVYLIQKGDTLWGLSERFINDPNYWPELWERNQSITNPHFIYPGQILRFRNGRLELESPAKIVERSVVQQAPAAVMTAEEVVPVRTFAVNGGEGFLQEGDPRPSGYIVSTYQNRQMVGVDDIVYTDIGKVHGANVGDRFSIYKKLEAVSHPVTNLILGHRVISLGALQLSELEARGSKALITKSFMEIGAGSFLLPYREPKVSVPLKASGRELTGYIVETLTGRKAIAAGDVAYIDLGKAQGVEAGNMLYIVRDVTLDQKYIVGKIDKLPVDVVGALVIVETGENTSTALIVKSVDTIYRGDRIEMKKDR